MRPEIKVYDNQGHDVTEEKTWYIGTDGYLYYTDYEGLHIDTEHHYEIVMKVTEGMIWQM